MMDVFYVNGIKYDSRDAKLVTRPMIEVLPDHMSVCGFMQCFLDREEETWLKERDSYPAPTVEEVAQ